MRAFLFILLTLSLLWGAKNDTPALSMRTYKRLVTVQNLIEQKRMKEAGEKLQHMLEGLPDSATDRAYIFNSAGMYYLQLEAYQQATTLLLQAYNEKALNEIQTLQLTELIGNLYMHAQNYAKAADFYKHYLHVKPNADKRIVLACGVAYYQLKDYNAVITLLKQEKERFKPDENLYQMLFASYYETKQNQKALETVNQMIIHWSHKREYWIQQSSLYYEEGKIGKALESMELAYHHAILTKESDYMQYIYLLLEKEIPYKAAVLLKRFIKENKVGDSKRHRELLKQSLMLAREKES